ncbi:MAG: alginate export family protein [Candidatus Omnitrophica bacterium]|nr:alginate export family protein [Candidatus Omnitrophota bacterium]
MKHLKALFVLALALGFAAPAFAETQNVKISGALGVYAFARNNYDLADGNDVAADPVGGAFPASGTLLHRSDGDEFIMSQTNLDVAADLTDGVSVLVGLANERDWNADTFGTAGTAQTGAENAAEEFDILLDQAYVQMKEIFYSPLTLKIGRQDIWLGRGFVVGNNSTQWDNSTALEANEYSTQTAFDALRATLDFSPWTVDVVYSKIEENAHGPEDDRDLWVAYTNYKFAEYNAVADLYFVGDIDRSGPNASGAAGTSTDTTFTYGARGQFDPISQMTLGGEIAIQTGDYRGIATSAERNRDAWALNLFGTYRFDSEWKPEATLEYVSFSGESELNSTGDYGAWNGLYRGKFWTAYSDFREYVYQTADANDQPASTNMNMIQIKGSLKPADDLWTELALAYVRNDESIASAAKEIGWEIDFQAVYNYTEDVTFGLVAGWFMPGDYYSNTVDDTATDIVTSVKVAF